MLHEVTLDAVSPYTAYFTPSGEMLGALSTIQGQNNPSPFTSRSPSIPRSNSKVVLVVCISQIGAS
ncbi:hypothetical protein BJ165DRAFT_1457614 [Panaeolus papilionaceus]|nr:hypothetical protein BJ165DRAFT_1457614 [Panaeolus papilionaceus]